MERLSEALKVFVWGHACTDNTRTSFEESSRAIMRALGDRPLGDFRGTLGAPLVAAFLKTQLETVQYGTARLRLRTLRGALDAAKKDGALSELPEPWPVPPPGAAGHRNSARYVMGSAAGQLKGSCKPPRSIPPERPRSIVPHFCRCAECGDEHVRRSESPTLSEIWEEYAATEGTRLETFGDYERRWREHIEPHFGHMPATAIEPHHLEAHLNRRRSERDERGVPSEGELVHEVRLPRRLLSWAFMNKRVPHSRIALMRDRPVAARGEVMIDKASIARLVDAADEAAAAFILLQFDCHLTRRETTALRWEHLGTDEKLQPTLHVISRDPPDDFIPLSPRAFESIQALRNAREAAGDADERIFKSSSWRRTLRKLSMRVFGFTRIEEESINSLMLVRSGRYWHGVTNGDAWTLERASGLKTPARERDFIRLTASQTDAAMERHHANAMPNPDRVRAAGGAP